MFHPFYVKNEDDIGEWKVASNLNAGDELLSKDGKKVNVSEVKVEKIAEEITAYNLELDEVHTYYVAGGVLVHNGCGDTKNNDGTGNENSSGSNGKYEKADYHCNKNNAIKNKAPNKGQETLDNSVAISANTTRRVGINDGEIVVFDETTSGIFHGHVRYWSELSETMKVALRKAGMVNKKGKII